MKSEGKERNLSAWGLFLLPFAMMSLVLLTSPNFRSSPTDEKRPAPLGGDFLQDWVGGRVILSPDRKRLYDLEFIQEAQHDSDWVGFSWTDERYFPMVYPPFYYLLISPFSFVSYKIAIYLWALVSTCLFTMTGFILSRSLPSRHLPSVRIWFVGASVFVPWLICQNMGQKSALLLFLFSVTYLLLRQKRGFWAGLIFGFVAIKPQLGIVIGLAMLCKRQWSFVGGALITVGSLVAVSWFWEPTLWVNYLQVVSGMGDYIQTGGYQLSDSHSLWAATRLAIPIQNTIVINSIAIVVGLIVIGLIISSLQGRLEMDSVRFAIQYCVLMLATVLLSPHFYTYDLTVLLLPMLMILICCSKHGEAVIDHPSWLRQTILCLAVVLYALGGAFSSIAKQIHFQTSVVVIGLLIGLLTLALRKASNDGKAGKASI